MLKRGDFFGEMALLQGGKRTATVAVGRRARLISLHRVAFNSLFLKSPKALEYFTRILCKRLADMNKGEVMRGSTRTISVGSSAGLKGKTLIATFLADYLHEITGQDVLRVSVHVSETAAGGVVGDLLSDDYREGVHDVLETDAGGISVLHIPARKDLSVPFYAERASNLISNLSAQFPFIVFDLNHDVTGLLDSVPLFSDIFIDIVDTPGTVSTEKTSSSKGSMKRFEVINLFNPGSRPISLNHCEPFVIPRDAGMIHSDASEYLMSNRRAPAALPVQRLARKILGASVGIALGGGAAFGIAHLGVLKVLEENNIPIDLVAGCSQGSLIGIGYAAGISVDEMIDMAYRLGRRQNALLALDPTLTKPGLLAGDKFVEIFRPLLGGRTTFRGSVCCRAAPSQPTSKAVNASGSAMDLWLTPSAPALLCPWCFRPSKSMAVCLSMAVCQTRFLPRSST